MRHRSQEYSGSVLVSCSENYIVYRGLRIRKVTDLRSPQSARCVVSATNSLVYRKARLRLSPRKKYLLAYARSQKIEMLLSTAASTCRYNSRHSTRISEPEF